MIRWILSIGLLLWGAPALVAQKVFAEEALVAAVKAFHPVARQASLNVEIARAEVTKSRGAFDPLLQWNRNRKSFDGTSYYDQRGAELKIPVWYGLDVYAGTEDLTGDRLNPEATKGSIYYMGVSMPLVQNLVMDKRRAALQQARLFQVQSEEEQRAALNHLLVAATEAYWEWWGQHHIDQLVQSALLNAQKRLQLVKAAVTLGDRPAIDTLEAYTQVQSFLIRTNEVQMALQKTRLELSAYLWKDDQSPYLLPQEVIPQALTGEEALTLDQFTRALAVHPELMAYGYKVKGLQIEKQLRFQSLLPEVNVKYQHMERSLSNTFHTGWMDNNYRFGIGVSVPLRLSEGRGAYKAARLKLDQARLAQINKQWQLEMKVRQYYVEWQQTLQQIDRQRSLVNNYAALQRGEEVRIQNGESSLFLLNARELKVIESQQKLVEWQVKNKQALVQLKGAAGVLVSQ